MKTTAFSDTHKFDLLTFHYLCHIEILSFFTLMLHLINESIVVPEHEEDFPYNNVSSRFKSQGTRKHGEE